MKHLDFLPTPVSKLSSFSKEWSCNLMVKRDDLFSKAGGGSKARMLQYILYPLINEGVKVVLTAGGPCSNFNRAIALLCAEYGLTLKLVSYTDCKEEYETSLNYFLSKLAGTNFVYCDKKEVPRVIEEEIKKLTQIGSSFRYIYGGGKSLEGIFAYYDAVKEIKEQGVENLDEVYVTCGTGTTLAGISAGMQELYPNTIVHGISVARTYEQEYPVLENDMRLLNDYLNKSYNLSNLVFHDNYLLGGYDNVSQEELSFIKQCISREGLIIDPTYTGKVFWAMSKLNDITPFQGKNILFWNTGGIFNLLSHKHDFE